MQKRTPELVKKAIQMRDDGVAYYVIGHELGVSADTARSWIDKQYAERRRKQIREARARRTNNVNGRIVHVVRNLERYRAVKPNLPDEEFKRLIADIPEDTRDLTARLCGDPLPGRSALDQRRAEQ